MSWLPTEVTVDATDEPVSLNEAKSQCRVDGTDEDGVLNLLITMSRKLVEDATATKIGTQTVIMRCNDWCDFQALPVAPIQSITSIKYLDADGVEQTLDAGIYESALIGLEPSIRNQINMYWPPYRWWNNVTDAIRVTAQAGYTACPPPLKQAMLLLISQWFDERSSLPAGRYATVTDGIATLPFTVEALLANYRRF